MFRKHRQHRIHLNRELSPFSLPRKRTVWYSAIIIIIITVYGVVIMTKVITRVTRFIWWMQTERRVAASPQTKLVDLGYESAENWLLPSTSIFAIGINTQPVGWYSFYCPTKGGRLSRPRHCSKGAHVKCWWYTHAQAVYRTSCRDKHNRLQCHSNLSHLSQTC